MIIKFIVQQTLNQNTLSSQSQAYNKIIPFNNSLFSNAQQILNFSLLYIVQFNKSKLLTNHQSLNNRFMFNLAQRYAYRFSTKVGFIGLGNMGLPMAINLSKKGFQVLASDVDHSKEAQIAKHNIKFFRDIKQIAKNVNTVVTMLPNSEIVHNTCENNGLFQHLPKGSTIIDSSTISPLMAQKLSKIAKTKNLSFVDAPVSGGVVGAENGTLTFMVGAEDQKTFQKVKPVLQAMGKNLFNCEKAGAGQIAKMANNMALAIQMIGVSQALALGRRLGIDDKVLSKIMSVSTSRCWSVDTYNPVPGVMENVPSSRSYDKGFSCQLMFKDLGIAEECAREVKSDITFGAKSRQIYKKLIDEGFGKKDFGIIFDKLSKYQQK